MRPHEHPAPAALLRFVHGEAALAESRAIVRHLLAGCRQCAAAVQPVWGNPGGLNWPANEEAPQ